MAHTHRPSDSKVGGGLTALMGMSTPKRRRLRAGTVGGYVSPVPHVLDRARKSALHARVQVTGVVNAFMDMSTQTRMPTLIHEVDSAVAHVNAMHAKNGKSGPRGLKPTGERDQRAPLGPLVCVAVVLLAQPGKFCGAEAGPVPVVADDHHRHGVVSEGFDRFCGRGILGDIELLIFKAELVELSLGGLAGWTAGLGVKGYQFSLSRSGTG